MTGKLGKSANDAIDIEDDDFVPKATTFKSVEAALRGVKDRQGLRTEFVNAVNKADTGISSGIGTLWGGRRLGEINASQQKGRVIESGTIELLDSSDEGNDSDGEKTASPPTSSKKDSVAGAQKKSGIPPVVLDLVDDSSDDDEVQVVDPPPGYVPSPQKQPHIKPDPPGKRKQPSSIRPDSTLSFAPSKVSSPTKMDENDEIKEILNRQNFFGFRGDLKPGENLSMAIDISEDDRKLSAEELELKEFQERKEIEKLLAEKAVSTNGNETKVKDTPVQQTKPQPRRHRTARSIVKETHSIPSLATASTVNRSSSNAKTLVSILKPPSIGTVHKAQSARTSSDLKHSSLETKSIPMLLEQPKMVRAAGPPNAQQLAPAIDTTSRKRPMDDAISRHMSSKVARGTSHQAANSRQDPQPNAGPLDQQKTRQFDQPKLHELDQQKCPFLDRRRLVKRSPVDQSFELPVEKQYQCTSPLDQKLGQDREQECSDQANRTMDLGHRYQSSAIPQLPLKRPLDQLTSAATARCMNEQPGSQKQHLEPSIQPRENIAPTPVERIAVGNLLEKHLDSTDLTSVMRNDVAVQICPDNIHDDDHDLNAFESNHESPKLDNFIKDLYKVAIEPHRAGTRLPRLLSEKSIANDCNPNSLTNEGNRSFRHYFEDDPLVEDSTYPGAIYSACQTEDNEVDHDLPSFMEPIEHLSEYTIGRETGLPEWTFYVYGATDDVLYKLKAFAAPSNIKGAQNGAFISFLGAYTLNSVQEERNKELDELVVENHDCKPITTEAIMPDGIRVSVTIIGEDLYEDYELRPYIALTRLPIVASIPPGAPSKFEKTSEIVRIVGAGIHDVYRKHNKRLEKKLQKKGLHPFGHLGTNVLTDYDFDSTITRFQIPCNCIDLGCYGPFIRSHLKVDDVFAIKSFIFQQNPNEWGFAVEDKVHGQELTVDITDDKTGLPSAIASFYIPMYVNEVGYSKVHRQNVFSRCIDGTRIHYFFVPGHDCLGINESIELYTNYKSGFESVRERRGYGKRNVQNGLPSDAVLVARLERNFSDREDAANELRMTALEDTKQKTTGLSRLVDFMRYEWSLLFPKNGAETTAQIVALRRLSWLANILTEIVDGHVPIDQSMKVSISEWITAVTVSGTNLYRSILQSRQSISGDIFECLKSEIIEEVLYKVRDKMPLLMDENLYCAIARDLIEDLCIQYCEIGSTGNDLLEAFVKLGLAAVEQIRTCAERTDSRARLSFVSREPEGTILYGSYEDVLRKVSRSDAFYLQHTTFSKGVLAAVSKMKREPEPASSVVEIPIGNDTLMAKLRDEVHRVKDARIATLCSIPVDTSASVYDVNVEWYIYWQVVWVLHTFSQKFVCGYDIQRMCKELGVDPTLTQFVVERGVRHDANTSFDDVLLTSGKKSRKSIKRPKKSRPLSDDVYTSPAKAETISQRPAPKLVYNGAPNTPFPGGGDWPPGWIQKTFKRASGVSKGGVDHYWFPPDGRKLRSYKEILRYMAKLH